MQNLLKVILGPLLKAIEGKKTYIVAVIAFVMAGLHAIGVVDQALLTKIDLMLGPLGLAFLRAGIGKNG
jgi:hypothetical protein